MRNPKPKARNRLSPELLELRKSVKEYEGRTFKEPKPCPTCGSEEFERRGLVDRLFCKLIVDDEGFEDVEVKTQKFVCKKCGDSYVAGPFYPKCVYGSPVVDLCLYLAASNPYNRIEKVLIDFGIQVDRDTVRNYAIKFEERLEEYAGIKLMGETIGVNFVRALFECGSIEELREEHPGEFFESCHDETYPAKKGAKKKMKEENRRRKFEGKRKRPYPEAFCAGFSYAPSHDFYASSVISNSDFNYLLAKVLLAPTRGVDWRVTDGHPSYGDFDPWYCLLHKFKKMAKKDEELKRLKKEFPHLVPDYLSEKYEEYRKEELDELKVESPYLFEGEEFKGSLTTNSMEGGNWRIKYELRTPYSDLRSISGRMNLISLLESLYTFRNGKPCKSWAYENSEFEFENVMSIELGKSHRQDLYEPPDGRKKSTVGGLNELIEQSIDQLGLVQA